LQEEDVVSLPLRFSVLSIALVVVAAAEDRKPAPDFALADSKGHLVALSGYQGRVVLLDFWATWCTGCKQEIPWYIAFAKEYKKSGLTVIGVSMDDSGWKLVKPFLKQHGMRYPVVIGNEELAKRYDLTSMPMTLLIDREGKIAAAHVGVVEKDAFERELQMLLAAPSRPRPRPGAVAAGLAMPAAVSAAAAVSTSASATAGSTTAGGGSGPASAAARRAGAITGGSAAGAITASR
jgi:peroxiredoxin